ncbi:MAG: EamA family transporter [Actinomycetota bacterium]|nr:EamA family transporter [Actinomycetota bacterium]
MQPNLGDRIPPHAYFVVSAVFHYLGPAFAALLFGRIDVLGVAWLRIVGAGAFFAAWRRPWRFTLALSSGQLLDLVGLGIVLAVMNACFYLAIDRLPLGTVGAIEFLGPVCLAALGARGFRNGAALALAVAGVYLLADVRFSGEPLGFAFAFANAALFVAYVVLGHRIAEGGGGSGVDLLAAAMLVASMVITPLGLAGALPALGAPLLVAAGVGVGLCSSVIPYVADQMAMARLPRATFALLLSILPATATIIGVLVLGQIPTAIESIGVLMVVAAVAMHQSEGTVASRA